MRLFLASLGVLLGMNAGSAMAQPRYELRWSAAEGMEQCPGEGAVAAEIAIRLGRNPFTHGADQILEVTLGGEAGAWTAALSVHREDGSVMWSRPLQSADESCYTLADAVVLSIVLMIDPAAMVAPADAPEEPSIPEAPPEVPTPPAPSATPPPPAPPNPRRTLAASSGVVLTGGVLPSTAVGVTLDIGGPIAGALRWGAGMRLYPEVLTADANFAFGLTATSLGLCADRIFAERVLVGGCAALHAGVIHGVVFNPEPTFPGDRFWLGLRTDGAAAVRIVGPLWVRLEVGVMFSLLRQTFTIRAEPAPVFQQSIAGLDGSLSLALRFE